MIKQGRSQDLAGGGANNLFLDLEICMSPCALAGGFGDMPPEKFFKNGAIWCVFCIFWI